MFVSGLAWAIIPHANIGGHDIACSLSLFLSLSLSLSLFLSLPLPLFVFSFPLLSFLISTNHNNQHTNTTIGRIFLIPCCIPAFLGSILFWKFSDESVKWLYYESNDFDEVSRILQGLTHYFHLIFFVSIDHFFFFFLFFSFSLSLSFHRYCNETRNSLSIRMGGSISLPYSPPLYFLS